MSVLKVSEDQLILLTDHIGLNIKDILERDHFMNEVTINIEKLKKELSARKKDDLCPVL